MHISDEGLSWFNEAFKFCTPLSKRDQVVAFKGYLNDLWTNIAMMDYPYPTSFLMPLPGNPVKAACQIIGQTLDTTIEKDPQRQVIQAISEGVNMYNNYTGQAKCLDLGIFSHDAFSSYKRAVITFLAESLSVYYCVQWTFLHLMVKINQE